MELVAGDLFSVIIGNKYTLRQIYDVLYIPHGISTGNNVWPPISVATLAGAKRDLIRLDRTLCIYVSIVA